LQPDRAIYRAARMVGPLGKSKPRQTDLNCERFCDGSKR
jgi:hypothetical protein